MCRLLTTGSKFIKNINYLTNPITGKELKPPVIIKNETINVINDNYYNRKFVGYKSDRPDKYIYKK